MSIWTKLIAICFPKSGKRSYIDMIIEPGNCLPRRLSDPKDQIRLQQLGVGYYPFMSDAKSALVDAQIPSEWTFRAVSTEYLVIMDEFGMPWITVVEDRGIPTMSVRPQYGWKVSNIDPDAGTFSLEIFHPHGNSDVSTRAFHPKARNRTLQRRMMEIDAEVADIYSKKGYPDNWRDLGASMS